jgi:hypothetical protein
VSDTTWNGDVSGSGYWGWFRRYFEEEQRSFSIEGTYDPSHGSDEVQGTVSCKECFALVASYSLSHLNGHRAFHDRLDARDTKEEGIVSTRFRELHEYPGPAYNPIGAALLGEPAQP